MDLIEISNILYARAHEAAFGSGVSWGENIFKGKWFSDFNIPKPNACGLYWFLSDLSLSEVLRPETLPGKGCDFGSTSQSVGGIFPESLLTKQDPNGLRVVYNGHENNVMNRVRQHFNLNNHNTGALGIKHYAHSDKNWVLKYFTTHDIASLGFDLPGQTMVLNLLNAKIGRMALENAWRIRNGWPLLCKQ